MGIDAGLTFGVGNSSGTLFSLPTQVFRLGYFLSDKLEFEPRFSINSISGGGNTVSTYDLEAGLLLIPDGDRVGKDFYLRPFVGIAGISVSGGNSANSGNAGVGVGLKLPFADHRLAHASGPITTMASGGGSNTIGLLAGFPSSRASTPITGKKTHPDQGCVFLENESDYPSMEGEARSKPPQPFRLPVYCALPSA